MTISVRNLMLLSALSAYAAYADAVGIGVIEFPQIVEQTLKPAYPAQACSEKLVGNGAADVRVDVYGFPISIKLVSGGTIGRDRDPSGLDEATIPL